jgi:hypothetical protein
MGVAVKMRMSRFIHPKTAARGALPKQIFAPQRGILGALFEGRTIEQFSAFEYYVNQKTLNNYPQMWVRH